MIQSTNSNMAEEENSADVPPGTESIEIPIPVPRTPKEWEGLAFSLRFDYAFLYGQETEDDSNEEMDDAFLQDLSDGYSDWASEHKEAISTGGRSEDLLRSGFDAVLYLRCPDLVRVAPMMLKPYHDRAFQIAFLFGEPNLNNESPTIFMVGLIAGHAAMGLIPIHVALDLIIDFWWISRSTVMKSEKAGLDVSVVDAGDVYGMKAFETWRKGLVTRKFRKTTFP